MKNDANLQKKEISHADELYIDLGLLSKKEVARILMVECCTVDRYTKKGLLHPSKRGTSIQSRVYFDKNEVLEFAKFKKI